MWLLLEKKKTSKLGTQGQAEGAASSLGSGEPAHVGQRAPKREGGTGSGGAAAAFTNLHFFCRRTRSNAWVNS